VPDLTESPTRAVLVAVQLPDVDDASFASSVAELRRLATTLGLEVVGQVTQRRGRLASGLVVGEGKLRELATWTGGPGEVSAYQKPGRKAAADDGDDDEGEDDGGDDDLGNDGDDQADDLPAGGDATPPGPRCGVVLVDHDLSPTQQRNLERATDAEVMDRSSVIVEIFHRHARSREARLQVEIARLAYVAPRLREAGGGGDRVRGGVGGKGAGESALELDRRASATASPSCAASWPDPARPGADPPRSATAPDRSRSSATPTPARARSCGRSPAARSTSPTSCSPPSTPPCASSRPAPAPILVSDTVGFIKKLPHDLVAVVPLHPRRGWPRRSAPARGRRVGSGPGGWS
jgi:GTP-binding protein HflX